MRIESRFDASNIDSRATSLPLAAGDHGDGRSRGLAVYGHWAATAGKSFARRVR